MAELTLLASARPKPTFRISPGMSLAQVEAELIRQTLINVTSNRAQAAQKLGISRRALQYKIKRYGLTAIGGPDGPSFSSNNP
jgi:DNA-binding NtrC family response regulator